MIVARREGTAITIEMRLNTLLRIQGLMTDVQNAWNRVASEGRDRVVKNVTPDQGTHRKIDATNYDLSMM